MKFRVLVIVTFVTSMVVAAGLAPPPAPAAADPCTGATGPTEGGTTVEVDCNGDGIPDRPPGENGPTGDNPDGGPGVDAVAACAEEAPGWADCVTVVRATGLRPNQICGYVPHPDQSLLEYYHPEAPPGSTLLYWICPRDGTVYTENTQVGPPGAAAPPPTPAEVAADVWVRVKATLLDPQVVSSPPGATPAFIYVPTFVAVANWQGVITEPGCQQGVCVTLTATPALTFQPGEPRAEAIACAGSGTVYDPALDPEVQASQPGACTHTFTHRTRGDGATWPGTVSITWTIGWVGPGGVPGSLPDFTLSAALPRQVDEVPSVVVGGEIGLG
jgi:hypothetical protein